jgi:chemotaxis protein MotA
MLPVIGLLIVIAAVVSGFSLAGGHVGALVHPSELVTIGGSAIGALVVMSPFSVLRNLLRGVVQSFQGNPFDRETYVELFQLLYQLFRTARRDGLLALEPHLVDPSASPIFQRYPRINSSPLAVEFIRGALRPVMDGAVTPQQLQSLLDSEIRAADEERRAPANIMSRTADSLPGFGIVAAVLGVVVTMTHIGGPVEEIGQKVGAALVGTFLGILLSYGFIAPLAVRMELQGFAETGFLRAIAAAITGFVGELPPKVAVEAARRGLPHDVRPDSDELEQQLKQVDAFHD